MEEENHFVYLLSQCQSGLKVSELFLNNLSVKLFILEEVYAQFLL